MSLKDLGTKIYFLIFGPIYRRLSRDVSLKIQDLARVQVEFQERWAAVISDELIALSVKANSRETDLNDTRLYSPADIIETAGRIHKSQDLVMLSKELQIPLNDLAQIYVKYSDVSATGVIRLMAMEDELKRMRAVHEKMTGGSVTELSGPQAAAQAQSEALSKGLSAVGQVGQQLFTDVGNTTNVK